MPNHALITDIIPAGFRRLCDATGAAWLRADAAGRILEVNEAGATLLGIVDTENDLGEISRSLQDALGELAPAEVRRLGDHVFTVGTAMSLRFNVVATRVLDDFELLLEEIPSLDTLQEELNSLKSQYRVLMEHSQNGVMIMNDSRLVYANRALADMVGYRSDELIGMRGDEFVVAEDLETVTEVMTARPWPVGEAREVTARLRMKHDIGVRHVSIRQTRIDYAGKPAFVGTVHDITDIHRGETALRDYAQRLRTLSQQIVDVQENERRNLARELHDEIGQQLTLLKISLERLRGAGRDEHALDEAISGTATLLHQVRSLSLELRPSMLDDLGLTATLRWYTSRAADVSGIRIALDVDPQFPRLSQELETLCFRTAQEAVTNALRHSGADSIEIRLLVDDDRIELSIADNGCGFDPAVAGGAALSGGSAGLLGMRERAALEGVALVIDSSPGNGSLLQLTIPRTCATFQSNSA